MRRIWTIAIVASLGSTLGRRADGQSPTIGEIRPYGVMRGSATDLSVVGTALEGRPRLIAPFRFTIGPPSAPNADAGRWVSSLVVDPATAVGTYVVRIQTDEGLSNPFLFSVGQVAQVAEREENNRFESAQAVPSPSVVEGQVAGTDVDHFRFPGKKGQTIVLDAACARIGSGVDPTIRLMTAGRKYVGSADDTRGLLTDARLVTTLPEDGDYVVELSDTRYQGGGRPIYRLTIGPVPVADEIYPLGGRRGEVVGFEFFGGTLGPTRIGVARVEALDGFELFHPRFPAAGLGLDGTGLDLESVPALVAGDWPEVREPADPAAPPAKASPPVVFQGRIETKRDEDTFALAVTPGQRLRVDVSAADLGSALDGVLQVRRPDGSLIATADDTTTPAQGKMKGKKAPAIVSPDPSVDVTVPAGLDEIRLTIRDLKGDGGVGFPYRIGVEPIATTFDLGLAESQVSIPRGGSALIGVTAVRQGYTGPIALDVARPPAGLTVRPGRIGEGQTVGGLTVSASADASFDRADLAVVGTATGAAGMPPVSASRLLVFAQQGPLPTNVLTQNGLPAALARVAPIGFETPKTPVEVVHGLGGAVPIRLTRSDGADAALAIGSAPPPPGFTVAAGTIAAKATEGTATVSVAVEAPLGRTDLGLTAKGTFDGREQTLALPLVSVEVVRPVAVEAPGESEVKAGGTAEIKGKVVRRGGFNEPVTIKLDGLPAGVKAEPLTVAPGAADFALKLSAEPTAAVAVTPARLAVAFQVAKKDYPTPPGPLAVKVVAKAP